MYDGVKIGTVGKPNAYGERFVSWYQTSNGSVESLKYFTVVTSEDLEQETVRE
jgi:hypothetical protein